MSYKTTIDLFRKYFDRQINFTKKAFDKSEYSNHPFVTISRLTGAGDVQFPERLVNVLNSKDTKSEGNWILFDKDILEVVLEEHDLPKEISRFMPEKKVSEIQDVLEQLFGLHPSEHKLIKKISDTILHLSHLGNVVLVGRGSNIITRNVKNGFHIKLVSSLDSRIEIIRKYFKMSRNASIKLVQKQDEDRSSYIKKYFSRNINDPYLYSLVINFDLMKVEDALDMITDEVIKIRKRLKDN
jgi:cytidylate kinase